MIDFAFTDLIICSV